MRKATLAAEQKCTFRAAFWSSQNGCQATLRPLPNLYPKKRLVVIATRHALPNDTRDQLVAELLDSQNQSFECETDDASLRAKLYKVAESLSQWGFVCETSVVDDKKVAKSGSNVVKRVTIVHRGESENENQKQDLLQVVFSKGISNLFCFC